MKLLKLVFFLLLLNKAYSQDNKYADVVKNVNNIQAAKDISIDTLMSKIINSDWNNEQKAYAIYYWIASNIVYDKVGFEQGIWKVFPSDFEIAIDTYKLRKGVCGGYAHLFKLMCNNAGIESDVIDGYARTEPFEAGMPIVESNHSWNALKLDNKWQLVDVTWASVYTEQSTISNFYFLTPPEKFIIDHFPIEDEWQLIVKPISKDEFDKYPFTSPKYFNIFNIENFPKNGCIVPVNGLARIPIQNPNLVFFVYESKLKKWEPIKYSTDKSSSFFRLKLMKKGLLLLRIDVVENSEINTFSVIKGILYLTIVND